MAEGWDLGKASTIAFYKCWAITGVVVMGVHGQPKTRVWLRVREPNAKIICVYIYKYKCIYVCVYIYIHTHTYVCI